MDLLRTSILVSALALTSAADAQAPQRVRGTITAVVGDMISVKSSDGRNADVQLAEKTTIIFTQPIALADIKTGDFLGVTSMKRADGALIAIEVRRFPAPLNPGHRPIDGRDDQTMTNATVAATVQSASGRDLTLTYDGGSQKIMVPESASISTLVPGDRSQLAPGATVSLTATPGPEGKVVAVRVQVTPHKSSQ
jgi:uncharacterized protein Veg